MMLDENLARMRAHRNNIQRYRRLLRTRLSDIERQFIDRRLAEERMALDALARNTFPGGVSLPKSPFLAANLETPMSDISGSQALV